MTFARYPHLPPCKNLADEIFKEKKKTTPLKVEGTLCEVFAIYVPLSQPLWVGHGTNTLAEFSL